MPKKKTNVQEVMNTAGETAKKVTNKAVDLAHGTKDVVSKAGDTVVKAIDENGNGRIDIEDIIIKGLKVPGIRIKRSEFLRRELKKRYPEEVIEDAIIHNPMHARIPVEEIDAIADDVITHERYCVSGISAALGTPGGVGMVATIPADIIQYYGYLLRTIQELLYLYGFPEIDTSKESLQFDSETMNMFIICFGVMYGVAGANKAIKVLSIALGNGVQKKLMATSLTKGAVYPIVRSVAKWFGIKMTKDVFSGFFKKAIPVVGGIVGGGITYVSFKPCCDNLKKSLQHTILSDPDYKPSTDGTIDLVESNGEVL